MNEQEIREQIYNSELNVTLKQKEWRAVLSALFNASVQMRGYGKIYDKIAKQTNDQVEKIYKKLEGGEKR